ncbi:MAG: hypothetical protein ABEJ91_02855 [Candidatus Nanohaloarchaea archaeon]
MEVAERHRYAAASLVGMALLGEGAILFRSSAVTVFYLTLLGGVVGIYFYAYSIGDGN